MGQELQTANDRRRRPTDRQGLRTDHGMIYTEWEEAMPLTTLGYLPYFAQFAHEGELFSAWCADAPLTYTSPNAPATTDVLGTAALSLLAGHYRYRHAACLYGDTVAAAILKLKKIMSHDSMMRAIGHLAANPASQAWLQKHLLRTYEPLLHEPYVLDLDPTVKPVYGHQEGACQGYNPTKPGRPSLCYHAYFVGQLRLVLDVDVHPGNETAGKYSHDRLWSLLDALPAGSKPALIRGDIAFGNEATMNGCEARGRCYLFKLRQSSGVKALLERLQQPGVEWRDHRDGYSSTETRLRLQGWTKSRRVLVCRRPAAAGGKAAAPHRPQRLLSAASPQPELFQTPEVVEYDPDYEWSVLVTNLDHEAPALAQLYRDRADCENALDELKNQWGWGGFTSRELKQTQLMARIVALVYNWWNIFTRLAAPRQHLEAVSSRPTLQGVLGRLVQSGRQRLLRLCATGDQAPAVRQSLCRIGDFINGLQNATQLTRAERWCRILSAAFVVFLGKKTLKTVADGPQLLLGV